MSKVFLEKLVVSPGPRTKVVKNMRSPKMDKNGIFALLLSIRPLHFSETFQKCGANYYDYKISTADSGKTVIRVPGDF